MSNKKFARELLKLNKQQRNAVDCIEGPVMLLAGPGTGKTQVVALRIANILAKTHANSRNILALTFTEAGVNALRERLITIIGPDAYQLTISTFHGFASELIAIFSYAFVVSESSAQIEDLEQYQIIDKIIQDPAFKLLRPNRAPTFHIPTIIKAIKTLKQENVSAEKLEQILLKPKLVKETLTKIQTEAAERSRAVLLELVECYKEYVSYLTSHRLLDYEDLILEVLEVMETNPEVKAYIQERYQYVLVDEYQDTNNSQNRLIEMIVDFFDQPNLFVVGDDKQAIYRFQGASTANMLHFIKRYPALKKIVLTENYRNPKTILQKASELISHNSVLLNQIEGFEQTLTAVKKLTVPIEVTNFGSADEEAFWIIKRCQQLVKEGVDPSDIAVIFRKNSAVKNFRELSNKMNLPLKGNVAVDLLAVPIVRSVLYVIDFLANPLSQTKLITALLQTDSRITAIEFAKVLKAKPGDTDLITYLINQKESKVLAVQSKELRALLELLPTLNLIEIVHQIIALILVKRDKAEKEFLLNLEALQTLLKQTEKLTNFQPGLRPSDLSQHFQQLKGYQVILPVSRVGERSVGVTVSTVHGVKGLEFDYVFMAGVSANEWKIRSGSSLIKLPDEIIEMKNWKQNQLDDERRLFYVGMTRAKKSLEFSYCRTDQRERTVLPAQFIVEMGLVKITEFQLSKSDQKKLLIQNIESLSKESYTRGELEFIRTKINEQPFSFSHMKMYQTCPKQYLLRSVLGLPESSNYSQIYGTAIHKAMENFFKKYQQTKEKPSVEFLVHQFENAIIDKLDRTLQQQGVEKGGNTLRQYYEAKSALWQLPVGVEYNFFSHHVDLDGIWLTGKFDRIDPIDPVARTVRIIDYKTGSSAKTRGQIQGSTQDSDGSVLEQLCFYSLLAKTDRLFPFNAREFAIESIDDKNKFSSEIFTFTNETIDLMAEKVKSTFAEILSRKDFTHTRTDFDQGCEICSLFN